MYHCEEVKPVAGLRRADAGQGPDIARLRVSDTAVRIWMEGIPLALGAALILISASLPFLAQPLAGNDDRLFARLARNILEYGWLGPYNNLTLAKGPFYPFFLALVSLSGLPFLAAQAIFYVIACIVLARAIGQLGQSRSAEFAVSVLLLLNPALFNLSVLHVVRDGLYVSLTMLTVALMLMWHMRRDARVARRAWFAAASGIMLAILWLTREEGIWILPTLLFIALLHIARVRPLGWRPIMREAMLLLIICGTTTICVGAVCLVNAWHYGVADIVEFKQTEFVAAYSALARIQQKDARPDVGFPRASLEQAYAVSPAAAELRSYMEGPGWPYLAGISCDVFAISPCDGEMHGIWLAWMLRIATAAAGRYGSAREARGFYGRLAREVNIACDDGRLVCTPPRHSLLPPIHWRDIGVALGAALRMVRFIVTLDGWWLPVNRQAQAALPAGLRVGVPPVSCLAAIPLPPCRDDGWFFDLVRTTLFVMPPSQLGPQGDQTYEQAQEASRQLPSVHRAMVLITILDRVRLALATVLPWMSGFALICFLIGGVMQISRARRNDVWVAAAVCAVIVMSRIGLLAPLDATMFPTVRVRYLEPIYPFVLSFCVLAPAALWWSARLWRTPRRRMMSP